MAKRNGLEGVTQSRANKQDRQRNRLRSTFSHGLLSLELSVCLCFFLLSVRRSSYTTVYCSLSSTHFNCRCLASQFSASATCTSIQPLEACLGLLVVSLSLAPLLSFLTVQVYNSLLKHAHSLRKAMVLATSQLTLLHSCWLRTPIIGPPGGVVVPTPAIVRVVALRIGRNTRSIDGILYPERNKHRAQSYRLWLKTRRKVTKCRSGQVPWVKRQNCVFASSGHCNGVAPGRAYPVADIGAETSRTHTCLCTNDTVRRGQAWALVNRSFCARKQRSTGKILSKDTRDTGGVMFVTSLPCPITHSELLSTSRHERQSEQQQ